MRTLCRSSSVLWLAAVVGCQPADPPPSPASGAAPTAAPPSAPVAPATALEGTYTLKSEALDGRPAPAEWLNRHKAVVIAGDKIIVRLADGTEHTTRFRLDPAQKPAHIDFLPPDGTPAGEGKTGRGIYKLDQGELVIAFNPEGTRPTTFVPGEGRIVQVLVRQGGNKE